MRTQYLPERDLSEFEEQPGSSSELSRFPLELESVRDLPKEQVLSYLTSPPAESRIQDLYDELTKETVNLRGRGSSPIFYLKPRTHRQDYFLTLQKWEGVVLEVREDFFLARLVDLTQQSPDEEAEFPIEEVSQEDLDLLQPGAVFYWNIGYLDKRSGQRTRASVIRFRRLPVWTQEEIESATREAKRIRDSIGWK